MKKIEAKTLEEAYILATKTYACSITELECEIVQYPSAGFLGFFAKTAMIVVAPKQDSIEKKSKSRVEKKATPVKLKKQVETKNDAMEAGIEEKISPLQKVDTHSKTEESVLDSFFDESAVETDVTVSSVNNVVLQEEIEAELKSLIMKSCFDIDVVEVDVIENTAYVFIDGEDAALLIGKEGYRYNALSYLISNWLQNKHDLYIKLEIAQFLASQQEMIRSYMEPVIEHVEQEGWGRTRALDGILVQIALEQLREEFPNKYVAIKRTRNGDRYVLINEFNKR